jgi:hypothetical protein
MNVLVLIGGREAIPVRAIPFLTNWEVLSPDVVAGVLAGDCDFFHAFKGLTAHHVEQGQVKAIAKSFWGNFVVRELIALSDRTRHNEVTHEDGMSQWRRESSALLPAGAFVWRDEFEPRFWARHGPEGETVVQATADGEFELAPRNEDIELDFDPFLSAETANLVLAGFAPQEASVAVRKEADFLNGFDAVALGHELDAEHWASLPTVQAKHAAMLMAGISPKHYPDPDQSPPPNADLPMYRSALYTLESYGQDAVTRSLRDWVLLAHSHGLQIDVRVLAAVASVPAPSDSMPRHELADEAPKAVVATTEIVGVESSYETPAVSLNVVDRCQREAGLTGVVGHTKDYILEVMRAAQWSSVKELYRELVRRADHPGSPFSKGTGHALGKLYVNELNKTLSESTLSNAMPRLRDELK